MCKQYFVLAALGLSLSVMLFGCGKTETDQKAQQLKMQAEKARLDLQEKANSLARNPPPELIKAAREQASAAAKNDRKD